MKKLGYCVQVITLYITFLWTPGMYDRFLSTRVLRVETFGRFTSQSRDCVDTCSNHCGIWGDESDIEKCYTCCSTDLCNKSISADRFRPDTILLVGLVLVACEFVHSNNSGSI
ncbi:hypothetical protein ACJMK2_033347 [Sinanodonta woodiana]|uniref:Snake toxin/toxin-like domain-containing protein n=1 Tax=Sinanodonta woodiana TaxID=1069815 RepID=A0ABD3WS81_SINWO